MESAVVFDRFAGEYIHPDVHTGDREDIVDIGELIIRRIPGAENNLRNDGIGTHVRTSALKLRTACHRDLVTADQGENALQFVRQTEIIIADTVLAGGNQNASVLIFAGDFGREQRQAVVFSGSAVQVERHLPGSDSQFTGNSGYVVEVRRYIRVCSVQDHIGEDGILAGAGIRPAAAG